jgi:hypothetical protein
MGTNGFVPSLLVFDVVPKFPSMSIDLPKQRDRMAALAAAQMEISAIVSENRITAALNHNVSPSVNRTYEGGEGVLVFRGKEKIWTGPMVVVLVEGKIITVKYLESERVLRFSTQQIKPFLRDSPSTDVDEDYDYACDAVQIHEHRRKGKVATNSSALVRGDRAF